MNAPIIYQWSGEAMEPLPRFRKLCDQQFCVGEQYRMEAREERSMASHNFYFASIHEAWSNLPEDQAERFPSAEHLRKYALIRAGFRDERSISCASKAEALRVAAFIKPIDDYAVVIARDALVVVYTAKSQSVRAMGKADFQASKDAVLDVIAGLIGVAPDALAEAGKAA